MESQQQKRVIEKSLDRVEDKANESAAFQNEVLGPTRGRLFIATNHPLAASLSRALAEHDGVAVVVVQIGLDRRHFE